VGFPSALSFALFFLVRWVYGLTAKDGGNGSFAGAKTCHNNALISQWNKTQSRTDMSEAL
jgi:hypothetical protein